MTAHDIIEEKRQELGTRLVILVHHYQADDIVCHADFVGDSLELARKVPDITEAEYIVFCGVSFMAETAAILAPDKTVFIPDVQAGCPLADMAPEEEVAAAWRHISSFATSVTPVTYVNSTARIKAFCGRNGGTVCTSGNAAKIFTWALSKGEKIFFMPDKNLGRNTARRLGIPDDQIVLWDRSRPDGGLSGAAIAGARVILWDGWCPVHYPGITPDDVRRMRDETPGVRVIVHPEADPQTVAVCDEAGSTAQILDYVRDLDRDAPVAVGTEVHMVNRLAGERPGVRPLVAVACEDMGRITPEKLAATLSNLDPAKRVVVPGNIAAEARLALESMLEIR